MKEIQGKIKLLVIPISNQFKMARITSTNKLRIKDGINWIGVCNVGKYSTIIGKLSDITEEQAAEFVDKFIMDRHENSESIEYENYLNKIDTCISTKESLISLLKANDIWIKEWKEQPKLWGEPRDCKYAGEKEEYNKLPDDLLLIKL
jgi:hypothetical protein